MSEMQMKMQEWTLWGQGYSDDKIMRRDGKPAVLYYRARYAMSASGCEQQQRPHLADLANIYSFHMCTPKRRRKEWQNKSRKREKNKREERNKAREQTNK